MDLKLSQNEFGLSCHTYWIFIGGKSLLISILVKLFTKICFKERNLKNKDPWFKFDIRLIKNNNKTKN